MAEQIEALRSWLYPFGILASVAFSMRFFVQWWQSERAGKSVVPRSFWVLSIIGNISLLAHAFIQLHFAVFLLQTQHLVLSWRNFNLMGHKPARRRVVISALVAAALCGTACFLAQQYVRHEVSWFRLPRPLPFFVPWWLHGLGCVGLVLFSLRFWLQWWDAERQQKSVLPESFWWLSLIGTLVVSAYFFLLADWVNVIGPLCAVVPYSRNLMLLRHSTKDDCQVVMIAGELSGDQIGGPVARHLLERRKDLVIRGVAGPSMREAGVVPWFQSESFQVMGIIDVLRRGVFLVYALRKLVRAIVKSGASVVVTIDQPSFSLALAKRLRARGFRGILIQLVAPTVWAYRPERAKLFAKFFDAIVPLFSFEVPHFREALPTHWAGHPVIEAVGALSPPVHDRSYLTLFPGSRPGEVRRNLSLQLQAAKLLAHDHIAIVVAPTLSKKMRRRIILLAKSIVGEGCTLVDYADRYSIMRQSKAAITKSGTVTLELALLQVPFVCCYVTGAMTRAYARYVMKLQPRLFALPNILLGKEVLPECILPPVSPTRVAAALEPYLVHKRPFPFDPAQLLPQLDPGSSPSARIAYLIGQKLSEVQKPA